MLGKHAIYSNDTEKINQALKSDIRDEHDNKLDWSWFKKEIQNLQKKQALQLIAENHPFCVKAKKDIEDSASYGTHLGFKHNKTGFNAIFFYIFSEINEEYEADYESNRNSLKSYGQSKANHVRDRLYYLDRTPAKLITYIVWLWRDHQDFIYDLYHKLGLGVFADEHKKRIAQENAIKISHNLRSRSFQKNNSGADSRQPHETTHQIKSPFGRIEQQAYLDPSAYTDLALKQTSFFEFFEDKSFATDTAIYDAREKKRISQYRKNGLNIIINSLRDNQNYQFNEGEYLSLNNIKDMNLISIGGPRSSFTTRLSFGFQSNQNNMSEHNLYYSYDISNTQNVIQENFGEGVLYVPKNIISSKNDVYQTSTQVIHDDKEILNTDLALLTLVANPFNHRKWHVIISACHGVGCAALSELLNNAEFQKESKYIDFMDGACPSKNYYQALIRLNVYWQNQAKRYEVNTSSGRYYEIIDVQDNLEASCLIPEKDAVSIYQNMLAPTQKTVLA